MPNRLPPTGSPNGLEENEEFVFVEPVPGELVPNIPPLLPLGAPPNKPREVVETELPLYKPTLKEGFDPMVD